MVFRPGPFGSPNCLGSFGYNGIHVDDFDVVHLIQIGIEVVSAIANGKRGLLVKDWSSQINDPAFSKRAPHFVSGAPFFLSQGDGFRSGMLRPRGPPVCWHVTGQSLCPRQGRR